MVISRLDMDAWVPLVTSLLRQNVAFENLSIVTPLLDSKSATSGVLLIVGGTSHDLGGECHSLPGGHQCLRLEKLYVLGCSQQHLYSVNYSADAN